MPLSTKAKEAVKIGLAVTTAYYVALRFSWMSPTWAATSVVFISLPTAGQSLNKGLLRMGGTLLAFGAGLFYLGLFPQDRWLMFISFTPYLAFVTYKVTGKDGQYFWFVAAFVAMMILTAGPTEPAHAFEFAFYRALETLIGILICTLISVFIWPRSNLGALVDVSRGLLDAQHHLLNHCRDQMTGTGTAEAYPPLRSHAGQMAGQFGQTIAAAASESYEVREVRHLWERLYELTGAITAVLDRLKSGLADLRGIDIERVLPDIGALFSELDARLVRSRDMLDDKTPGAPCRDVQLSLNNGILHTLSHFQQAAVEVARIDLEQLDNRTRALVACVWDMKGHEKEKPAPAVEVADHGPTEKRHLTPLDPDRFRAVVMVVVSMWSATLIWIYIDPPGHVTWFQFVPSMALAAVQAPHMKIISVKPFALAYGAGLLVYVFVLPMLSVFWQLGIVLFTFSFVTAYFFSGMARVALFLAMFNMFGIQNTQTYSFAAMANTILFVVLALALVSAMTYITRGPRPEKTFLSMLGRFFRSSAFLVSRLTVPEQPGTLIGRMKKAYHRQEMYLLPGKLGIWGKQIDHGAFPGSTPDQVVAMVASLQLLADRTGELMAAHRTPQSGDLVRELGDEVRDWRTVIEQEFQYWSKHFAVKPGEDLRNRLSNRLTRLDDRIERTLNRPDKADIPEEKRRNFYRLLGTYRGLTEAAVGYAEAAGKVDVQQFREEKF